ncbi:MAG TPA: hypothetical protein GXX75_06785 [Clostridiales bacterium]|nr:hypothetical protein [Clostridiales bacterium]
MAINFTGVNGGNGWQNAPSVSTPLNAENLNIDEAGIKAACNGVDDLNARMIQSILNDPTKYVSAAVVYSLAQTVQSLNDKLAVTSSTCVIPTGYTVNGRNSIIKTGKDIRLTLNIKAASSHALTAVFANVPEGYRPASEEDVFACMYDASGANIYPCMVKIYPGGGVIVSSGTLGMYVFVDIIYKTT